MADPRRVIEEALGELGVEWESPGDGRYVVTLPGTRKLSTTCSLVVGRHSLSVNAFVIRRPDENHGAVHRWLLERNPRLHGVAFAVDALGDVYLVGRLPPAAVTPEEIDRLLGAVLDAADSSFNTLLELGFAGAIRREHAWRTSRGLPPRPPPSPPPPAPGGPRRPPPAPPRPVFACPRLPSAALSRRGAGAARPR
ncbi:YbjN domain-containing protein [Streptomyces sp. SBT349]|uniref:YbjN domain-containing protein n=1 Tax=Streptomyces sp. SBT349 TaxID=1580539 RepID=UPI00099C97A6|nr:YbjN domain-containing protein [Streptomyces sp. SBT349]